MKNKNVSNAMSNHSEHRTIYKFTDNELQSLREFNWLSKHCLRRKLLENEMEIPEYLALYDDKNEEYALSDREMETLKDACRTLEQHKGRKRRHSESEQKMVSEACRILEQSRTKKLPVKAPEIPEGLAEYVDQKMEYELSDGEIESVEAAYREFARQFLPLVTESKTTITFTMYGPGVGDKINVDAVREMQENYDDYNIMFSIVVDKLIHGLLHLEDAEAFDAYEKLCALE